MIILILRVSIWSYPDYNKGIFNWLRCFLPQKQNKLKAKLLRVSFGVSQKKLNQTVLFIYISKPTKPTNLTKQTKPTKQKKPTKATKQTKPAKTRKSTKSTKLTKPTKPMRPIKPTKLTKQKEQLPNGAQNGKLESINCFG